MTFRNLCLLTLTSIPAAFAGPVEDAGALLQRQKYQEAAAMLTDAALGQAPDKGYARYLRAVAFAEAKQFARAIADCDAVPDGDAWHRKARFLSARCLAELKRHQEAEAIFSAESARLFSTVRQEKLAEALVTLAREIKKPAVAGQSVTPEIQGRALGLFLRAIEIETGPVMREGLLFETAELMRDMRDGRLNATCETYFGEFDPDWPGGKAKLAGAHRWEIRVMRIESALRAGQRAQAIALGGDLLALWKRNPLPAGARPDAGDVEWLICRAHSSPAAAQHRSQATQVLEDLHQVAIPGQVGARRSQATQGVQSMAQTEENIRPQANGIAFQQAAQIQMDSALIEPPGDPVKHIESVRAFLKNYPNHPRAAEAAWTLARVLAEQGKADEAIGACKAVYERADWAPPAAEPADPRPPAERLDVWRQEAFYKVGELHFSQRRYAPAIEQWRAYISRHPDGGLWQRAQAAIMDSEFQLCLESVAGGQRDEAAKRFDAFIAAHPLDPRCAQLLFLNGQWPYADALGREKPGQVRAPDHIAVYERAIGEWAKLIVKHPASEEAALALYRTGCIQADVLGRYEEALAVFQRVPAGNWKAPAAERAAMLPEKSLALRTPRIFRSTEAAHVRVDTRNIEKLRVSRYTLNLEDYFRSRHRLDGPGGIGSLDIDLIQPDKTWEQAVPGFARLRPIEQNIAIPFDGVKPGVCLVRVEGDDWQASTVVIRSDIDVVVQAAWTEALVWVQDRVKGTVVANAEVLLSNGAEIIAQGRTGADGVFRFRGEPVRAAADLCAYVRTPAGEAIQRLDLRGMTQEITGGDADTESVTPARRGFIDTDKPAYRAGDTVQYRAIIRDVKDGAYFVPAGREYEVRVIGDGKRVLQRTKLTLGEFGTFAGAVPLPDRTPAGDYTIVVRAVEGDEVHRGRFQVREFVVNDFQLTLETKPDVVFRGDRIDATFRARTAWGLAVANEAVEIAMPDGRTIEGRTDANGAFAFSQDTTGFRAGDFVNFSAKLKAYGQAQNHRVGILKAGVTLVWERLPAPAIAGEAAVIRVKALSHAGKPVATRVKLAIARKPMAKPNPVLGGLPGLSYIAPVVEPVLIEEVSFETDPVTGIGEARPLIKDPAPHALTARAVDARGNPVETSAEVGVSGPDDPQKLLIFSDTDEVNEGAPVKIDAHSRIAVPFALVTFAGESIIEHRVVPLVAGHNEIALNITAAHWPQFDAAVACLDGGKLHRVRRGFTVSRPLKIEIKAPPGPIASGREFELGVTTKDGLGRPVAAELSVALANAEFSAACPDERGNVGEYFAANLRRRGSVRTGSTAAFEHLGTVRVQKRDDAGNALATPQPVASHVDREDALRLRDSQGTESQSGREVRARQSGGGVMAANWPVNVAAADGQEFEQPQIPQTFGQGRELRMVLPAGTPTGSVWRHPVVTDAEGKATVRVVAPDAAGAWRLRGIGITKGTMAGESVAKLVIESNGAKGPGAPAIAQPVGNAGAEDGALQFAAKAFEVPGALDFPAQARTAAVFSLHDSPVALLSVMGLAAHDALDRVPRTPQTAASGLLSAVSALRAVRAAGRDETALAARVRLLISALQVTQASGGWPWQDLNTARDSVVTSVGLWALVEARALGFTVEDAAVDDAVKYLKAALAVIPPDEPEKSAVILHALALVNQADFSVMNRMLRERAKLNDVALAHLAGAFQRLERAQDAQELLKALEARPGWKGSTLTARLSGAEDTTAMVLYVAARAQAGSPLAKRAADLLESKLGVACGADSPLRGIWTAALAEHFVGVGSHRVGPASKLTMSVDGVVVPGGAMVFRSAAGQGGHRVDVSFEGKAAPILLATSAAERGKPVADESLPTVSSRRWLHEGMRYRDAFLPAEGTSPVGIAAHGQRIRVRLSLKAPQKVQGSYVIVDEPIPAGCILLPDSIQSGSARIEELPGKLRLWFAPATFAPGKGGRIVYDLIALHPGDYSIPATTVSDACRPERRSAGPAGKLTILAPGKPSPEPYVMNRDERMELANALFGEGKLEDAREHLEVLRADASAMKQYEREIARMLLWAHTARAPMEAKQVVELFEVLSERHSDIVIPFDRILKVAEAYRQIGEFERAWLVHRATMESAFVRDAGVSAAIAKGGDFPGSIEHQVGLWREYPDMPDISLAYFSLAQSVQEKAGEVVPVRPGGAKPSKTQLLERSRDLLRTFVTVLARDELADDAAFSLANVFFDLKDYAAVVQTAGAAAATHPKSPFANSFLYMTALGHFWQYQFPQALAAASPVAAGSSDDAANARYISAQILHAQEKYAEALVWYEKVKGEFDDAAKSIEALREKGVRLPPATSVKPGEPVKVELGFRNVKDAALKIYRVDLMRLHERGADPRTVGGVNLAGITPEAELALPLGDGADYAWKKRVVDLPMKQEGAYLVICRGDSQMTSGLVILTTLALDVNEDADLGGVRVQVRDTARGSFVADADIAAYDSTSPMEPDKGRTDPRGAFSASGIEGYATVVVKLGDARYAYWRSVAMLRPAPSKTEERGRAPQPNAAAPAQPQPAAKPMNKADYLMNVKEQFKGNQLDNKAAWEGKMKSEGQGVKAEKAFKK